MQKMFSIVFVLMFTNFALAQPFKVVKTWGNVKNGNGGLVLKGAELQREESVSFETKAKLILTDRDGNLFWSDSPEGATFPLDKTLRNIQVKTHRGFLAKSAGVTDLKGYFGSSVFTIIGNKLEIPVDAKAFPLNNAHFIVFYYKLNGVQVSKKIGFNNQKLILEKEALTSINNRAFSTNEINEIEVYEYFPNTKQSNLITTIALQFVNKEEIEQEVLSLVGFVEAAPERESAMLEAYLENAYGKFDGIQQMTLKKGDN